ncbi:MAG TPA: HupE/UreJ family protein [Candidatus Krumholzibacteria bacterium]|nr:HupE/UreJ family protein [Candidatus Krumholzibacteria bacterium]
MRRAGIMVALCLWPAAAHAHLVSTGFGAFYDGVAHLVLTPQDWLVVVAMGLLAGLCGRRAARASLVVFPMAWFAGGIAGAALAPVSTPAIATAPSILVVGILVAFDRKLTPTVVVVLSCLAGLLHGFINGATMNVSGRMWLALLGASTVVFACTTLLAAMVVSLRARWTRVMIRVAGSWIAATGILLLGWLLRGVR